MAARLQQLKTAVAWMTSAGLRLVATSVHQQLLLILHYMHALASGSASLNSRTVLLLHVLLSLAASHLRSSDTSKVTAR
jgi:hypothetical protein